ncbi:hypothetical protein H4R26_005859, partial [Coemansia thaxteri]
MQNRTHMLYMDDTAVFLRALTEWPKLQQALDWYCAATTAKFNEAKTEIIVHSWEPTAVPEYVPVHPLAEGETLRYLGIRLGAKVPQSTRTAERNEQIAKIIADGNCALRGKGPLATRAYVLNTFIIPRFQFLFRYESFTMEQVHRAENLVRRAFWGRIHGYMPYPVTALPRNKGGFGLQSVLSIYRATRLKQVATFAAHTARWAQPTPEHETRVAAPDWHGLLLHLWQITTDKRQQPAIPKPIRDLGFTIRSRFLYDPFSQIEGWTRLPGTAWPQVWQDAFSFCHDGRAPMRVNLSNSRIDGAALLRPLLGYPGTGLDLPSSREPTTRMFYEAVKSLYGNGAIPLENLPPLSLNILPNLAIVLHEMRRGYHNVAQCDEAAAYALNMITTHSIYCT